MRPTIPTEERRRERRKNGKGQKRKGTKYGEKGTEQDSTPPGKEDKKMNERGQKQRRGKNRTEQ